MAFKNRIRLPFYVTRPQFPTESNTFRLANGARKTLSSTIRKVFEGETDNLPRELHERLVIALKHDDVNIEGKYYLGGVSLEGDYDIDWNKFLDFPLAKATFKVEVTPFDYSNDNCQTCDAATQLNLQNDLFQETLDEGQTYEINVYDNDSICCSPITASIVKIDSAYISSAVIDEISGVITVIMKSTIDPALNVNLLTYRVTCPNGTYDEADVFGDTNGTIPPPSCPTPTNLQIVSTTETEATITWDNMSGALLYFWQLYLASDLITPISSGGHVTNNLVLNSLTPGTNYVIYVQTNCGSGGSSGFANASFTTEGDDEGGCGQYQLYNNDFPTNYAIVTYIDCNGNEQNIHVQGSTSVLICALQNSPGDPVSIFSNGSVDINYFGEC